ncbi:hypothetical protein ACI00O_004227 [Cronobacter sakazakii]|nr:hypothetical protein [Cronobacter sakazakii]EKK5245976.1 hypothetical protein [Cronobacter sakazakii]ELY4529591.1 hypothetical protein [Cronobacter sakazakii]
MRQRHDRSKNNSHFAMKAGIIVVMTLLAILFISLSDSELATEIRNFLRALLRALF